MVRCPARNLNPSKQVNMKNVCCDWSIPCQTVDNDKFHNNRYRFCNCTCRVSHCTFTRLSSCPTLFNYSVRPSTCSMKVNQRITG